MTRTQEIAQLTRKCVACKLGIAICLGATIALFAGSFFVPPKGVIDASILKAGAELFAFAALIVGARALAYGYDLKIVKGDTEINLNNDNK